VSDDIFKASANIIGLGIVKAVTYTSVKRKKNKLRVDTVLNYFEYIKDVVNIVYVILDRMY
jgi:hypothetical protein